MLPSPRRLCALERASTRAVGSIAALLLLLASPLDAAPPKPVTAEARVSPSSAGDDLHDVRVVVAIDDGWHINGNQPRQHFLIPTELRFELPSGADVAEVVYPDPVTRKLEFAGGRELELYEGSVEILARIRGLSSPGSGLATAVLDYQACNDKLCLRPATLNLPLTIAAPAQASTLGGADASVGGGQGSDVIAALVDRGLWAVVPGMLLLGLALNLTPCVYPLIGVTLAFFGGQAQGSRSRRLWLAIVYTFGIAVSFSILGVTAALSGGLFGGALANPAVNIALALLMFALAASTFGLYQMRVPTALATRLGQSAGGAAGAMFMGMTMGLVAAPCVGPVVVGLLVFVGSRGDMLLGLSLFFLLAVGLGLPYIALAMAAGSIAAMPRSGGWLQWTEHFFGCVLVAMGIYFLRPVLPDALDRVLMPGFIALAAVWLGFFDPAGREFRGFLLGRRVAAAVGLAVLAMVYIPRAETQESLVWEEFTTEAFDRVRNSGAPFVIEFGAEWCIPCKEMEERTFNHPSVVEAAQGVGLLSVDMTTTTDFVRRVLSSFEVLGAPTTLFYGPDGKEWTRRAGFIGPEDFADLLDQSRGAGSSDQARHGA